MFKNSIEQKNIKSSHTNEFAQILVGFYLVSTENYFRNFLVIVLESFKITYCVYWYEFCYWP